MRQNLERMHFCDSLKQILVSKLKAALVFIGSALQTIIWNNKQMKLLNY